jgi:hypothetical protein
METARDTKDSRTFKKEIDNVSGHVVTERGFRGREESMCLGGTQGWIMIIHLLGLAPAVYLAAPDNGA